MRRKKQLIDGNKVFENQYNKLADEYQKNASNCLLNHWLYRYTIV